ncbi:EAL domain-containing protein [Kineosporia rhizophila]|uniref:putative bifunctional diguanylate cyclase/phosphodiesterase n=1 Tax=Kineosporia rhizophila TaxID=84633 RepID=UPI001E45FF4B|nr:EAL domain-containing protein [Kineosporia rhizophila]
MTTTGPGNGTSGPPLWLYLAALLCVSALCVAPFAALTVSSATDRAATARRMQEAVRSVVALEATNDALNSELMPSVLLGLFRTGVLRPDSSPRSAATFASLSRIATSMKRQVRDATNDTLEPLRASQPDLVEHTAATLRGLRARVDASSMTATDLQEVYRAYGALAERLNDAQSRAAATAVERGVDLASIRTVQNITDIAAANLAASRELPAYLMSAVDPEHLIDLPKLGPTWSQMSRALGTLTEPELARAWRTLTETGTLETLDVALTRLPSTASTNRGDINRLLALEATRAGALSSLLYEALLVADRSAVAYQDRTNEQMYRALVVVALLVLTALAAVMWVSRAIARPLGRLSAQARDISRGHLVEVGVGGPREVQAASQALQSMVHNLRRIEGQSAAVASGDLVNPLLQEPLPGPLGEVVHSSVARIVTAVREREELQAELTHAATHDALTGLANRPRLLEATRAALARRPVGGTANGTGPALLFVDLDGFKAVNDTHGHAAGDQLLTAVAQRLDSCARAEDLTARLGGDEFVVLIEKVTDAPDAVAIAERLIEEVSRPVTLVQNERQIQVRVGASVGVALAVDPLISAETLFSEADAAVYEAKARGRGCCQLFDEVLQVRLRRRQELQAALNQAVTSGQFELDYVPVVDLASMALRGWDARVWWARPGHDKLSAAQFRPVAEETRRQGDIDRWALSEAVRQMQVWDQAGESPSHIIAVSVSLARLLEPGLAQSIIETLEAGGLSPRRLVLHVPEAVLTSTSALHDTLGALRRTGVLIVVDEFGRDQVPVGLLDGAPIDGLRLYEDLVRSPHRAALLQAVLDVARAAGLAVSAQNVNDEHTLRRLQEAGCDLVQGALMGPLRNPSATNPPQSLVR